MSELHHEIKVRACARLIKNESVDVCPEDEEVMTAARARVSADDPIEKPIVARMNALVIHEEAALGAEKGAAPIGKESKPSKGAKKEAGSSGDAKDGAAGAGDKASSGDATETCEVAKSTGSESIVKASGDSDDAQN